MSKTIARRRVVAKKKPAQKAVKAPAKTVALTVSRRPLPSTLPESGPMLGMAISAEPSVVPTWVGKFKLDATQIAALRKPVDDDEIDWKPLERGGEPQIPYLSHNGYRDRLDAAFGLGGWGMVPTGIPKEKESILYMPYALVVDGLPRAYTWGEGAYHPNNKQMTYGDALESCKSNAIVRCGKDLGIARDLWSKRYLSALKKRVPVKMRGGDGPVTAESNGQKAPPTQARTGNETAVISEGQRKRLFAIAKTAQRSNAEVKAFLKSVYQIDSTEKILRKDYDAVIAAIEKAGPLVQAEEPRRVTPDAVLDSDINWGGGR